MSEIEGIDNNKYRPYENTGIQEGDMIVEINKETVTCTADLLNTVNKSKGNNVAIKYVRDGEALETSITPVKVGNNSYKLGLWVRDAAAGVGTVSFYEPSTKTFAALGHGIQDVDTRKFTNNC
ncbi:MAG: PDZ domain-containing protein [Clostridia bacterium]|nr:PDZ domain-containing protein [Clostridia bacterium]